MRADQPDTFDGERVLWAGQPVRFPIFDVVGVLVTGVGIYCLAGAVFSVVSGMRKGNTITVVLATMIGVCVLVVMIGRPVLRRASLRTTRYLLTESRIVVCSSVANRRILVAHLRNLSQPLLTIHNDSSVGTIKFDGSAVVLLEVENARQVHQLIIAVQANA